MMKPYVVGIDIGGTNTVFGIVDARGQVVASDSIKTMKHADFDDYVDELHDNLSRLLKANEMEDKIQGIGIGAPNGNYYTGEIVNPPNLPWGPRIPLAEKVSKAFNGIPVAVTNDANAAALGEMTYGAARGMKDFIMITLGTGVGSGIVINGQLVYGSDGFAGELGHVIVKRNNGRICGCGRTGCLIARLPVWPVPHANSWKSARNLPCSVIFRLKRSHPRMSTMPLWQETRFPKKFSNIRARSSARLLPT